MSSWSVEQIIAFAPDKGSASAAQALVVPSRWSLLGSRGIAVWGECKGSGSKPYLTGIDLSEPAFKCSCPSRKIPCKHALALFLLYSGNPEIFTSKKPPHWIEEWMEGRRERDITIVPEDRPDPKAQARRDAKQTSKVEAGVGELELWLSDLIRNGIASAPGQPYAFWDTIAARMVDAQAPGLARQLRELSGIASSGDRWPERFVARLGRIHLLLAGFRRLGDLPPEVAADIRTQIGWTQRLEEIRALPGIHDTWHLLGRAQETEERLRVQRNWLWGERSGRPALLLQFAHGQQQFEFSLLPGTSFEAELAFFPSATPLRVAVKEHLGELNPTGIMPGFERLLDATDAYSTALGRNPWIERFPMALRNVIPGHYNSTWGIRDNEGRVIPLHRDDERIWKVIALAGGHPVHLFGEWNGETLYPLSVVTNTRFIPINNY